MRKSLKYIGLLCVLIILPLIILGFIIFDTEYTYDNEYHYTFIDPCDIYHVKFHSGGWGSWAIQDARDWDFTPPTYVEVHVDIVDIVDCEFGEDFIMIKTFNLFDEYHNLINQYITSTGFLYRDNRPIPTFTGTYTIARLRELDSASSCLN